MKKKTKATKKKATTSTNKKAHKKVGQTKKKASHRPIRIRGGIGDITCDKTPALGGWSLSVTAALLLGAGESVFAGSPYARAKDSSGGNLEGSSLTQGSGNTYSATFWVHDDPASVTVTCRFVSDEVPKDHVIP